MLLASFQFLLISAASVLVLWPFLIHAPVLVLIILATLIGAVLHPLIKKLFQRSTALVKSTERKFKESTYTYKDLAQNIVDLTMTTIPVEMTAVYFYDINKKEFYLCAQKGMKNELAKNLRYNRSALLIPLSDPMIKRIEALMML